MSQRREPILNVPACRRRVARRAWPRARRAGMAARPDDVDRVLVWSLAFVPARYDASALTDGILPGGCGRRVLELLQLRAAPRRLDASRLQRGLAARLRQPGGAPVRRDALSSVLCGDDCGGRVGLSAGARRRAGADDRRVGGHFRHDGRGGALCFRAGRLARHVASAIARTPTGSRPRRCLLRCATRAS